MQFLRAFIRVGLAVGLGAGLAGTALADFFPCRSIPASACLRATLDAAAGATGGVFDVRALDADDSPVIAIRPLREGIAPRLPVAVTLPGGQEAVRWFAVRQWRDIPVWTRAATANQPAAAAQPRVERRDTAAEAGRMPGVALPATDIRLRRAVRAGEPVRTEDLRGPDEVLAGESVRYALEMPGIRLSGEGRALADGHIGETARILPRHAAAPFDARILGVSR